MELRMLGSIEIAEGDTVAALGPAGRKLLGVLLVHRRRVVSLDALADALWGAFPPTTARPTLQTHLSKLRRIVQDTPGASIDNRPPGYTLEASWESVDADRFERLVTAARLLTSNDGPAAVELLDQALACWQGPALAEFADTEWAQAEAARLDELRLVAVEERADVILAAGGHHRLVAELEAAAAENPLRERLRSQLMLALHRSGRQAEALRSAQDLRCHLGEELGLEPSFALRKLEQAVAANAAELEWSEPSVAHPTPSSGAPRSSGATPPSSLPIAPTTLVGREPELDQLATALASTHLLTLVGAGGVGKSRMAYELARRSAGSFPDGLRVVELAPVDDDGVGAAAAAAFGVERRAGRSLEESIIEVLAPLEVLVVLDNCEHVRPTVGRLVGQVLRWCPAASVIATSREPIGMPGETVWGVPPLAVPADSEGTVEAIAANPAVEVFVNRAQEAAPSFALAPRNARAVADLCVQLDGVPLALELAAARMGSMSPTQLLERLNERFTLLSQGPAVEERHRTLIDVVQWSYELLEPSEQLLLRRLSVFAGGFDLDAAERTCGHDELPTAQVLPRLVALVEKSLVVAEPDDESIRYRQLETIRQYGSERLDEQPEAASVRRAHRATFAALAEEAQPALDGPDEGRWSARLDREIDNLRAAVRTALMTDDADTGLRLVVASRELSFRRMRYELIRWAEELTALPSAHDHPLLPVALGMVAYGSFVRGELRTAIEQAERSLGAGVRLDQPSSGLAERVLGNALVYQAERTSGLHWMARMTEVAAASGSDARLAHGTYMRSVATTSLGDPSAGAELAEESMRAASRSGSPTARSQAAYAVGLAAAALGDPPADADAIVALDDSIALADTVGNRWMRAFAMTEAMWLRARSGETPTALAGYREVVETWFQSGDWANQWLSLRQLAGILASAGRDEEAALLFGAVTAAGARMALPFAPTDADDLEQLGRQLETRLGPDTVAAHRRRGGMMRDEAVVATALAAIDDLLRTDR